MEKINKNTFIDNTLVTCAEYQLFIDEMKVQGIYYQPIHWGIQQFPIGHAHLPILGVSYEEAKGFCEWLSNREENNWIYRLPTSDESKKFLLENQSPDALIGYWAIGMDEASEFVWVTTNAENKYNQTIIPTLHKNLNLDKKLAHNLNIEQSFKQTLYRAYVHPLLGIDRLRSVLDEVGKELANAIDSDLGIVRSRAKQQEVIQSLERANQLIKSVLNMSTTEYSVTAIYTLSSYIDLARKSLVSSSRKKTSDIASIRSLDIINLRFLDLYRVLELSRYLIRSQHLETTTLCNISRDLLLSRFIDKVVEREIALDLALDIYTEICTIDGRALGKLPAYESIRIVKSAQHY